MLGDTFRAPQKRQDKAQRAGNGCSLVKRCNAVMAFLGGSLRASRWPAICGVTFLGKGAPFPAKRALQLTGQRLAESTAKHATVHQLIQRIHNSPKDRKDQGLKKGPA
ncbi:hypothetical protein [Thiohalomonas denitrificans]|uniref:Uncharacterized protein n=1 Tax=Thiohalomonas denitrificans TaxID=415747 RepID=A0A1G5QP53_9GAMM|nr:hypothetical protein [Thiohalomonas denitrificans]SCZ63625.1 hypothetical protein SAMN03097708_02515 [Thiohalomonas denitrificans]